MKRLKKLKGVFKFGISALLICFIFFAPIWIFPTIFATQNQINKNTTFDYLGILELWNVDTFEGGSVSRTSWLEKRAIEFESEHRGTFVVVENITPEQLVLNLENGNLPDMISFGIGVGENLVSYLQSFETDFAIRQDLVSFGKFNGRTLAVPYLLGGYSIIKSTNGLNNVVGVGLNSYTCPLLSLVLNDESVGSFFESNFQLTSYDAYDQYLKQKFGILIGTQRDVYRTNNRVQKAMLTEQDYKFLSGFTDLIQYVGITTREVEAKDVCQMFVQKLLSKTSQDSLKNIGMFSVNNSNLYTAEPFVSFEQTINNSVKSINVFVGKSTIDKINQLCVKALLGDNSASKEVLSYLK